LNAGSIELLCFRVSWRYQALAQPCAFVSPFSGILSPIGISRQQLRLFSLNCYSAFLFRHERICHTPNIKQTIINGISANISSLIGAVTVFSHRSIRISYKNSRSRTAADTARCVRRTGKRTAARPNRTPLNRERTTIHCSTYM